MAAFLCKPLWHLKNCYKKANSALLYLLHTLTFFDSVICITTLFYVLFFSSAKVYKSSHPEVLSKKDVLRNFAKFTGRLWPSCFPVNFAKFLRTPLVTKHHRWLLRILFLKTTPDPIFINISYQTFQTFYSTLHSGMHLLQKVASLFFNKH